MVKQSVYLLVLFTCMPSVMCSEYDKAIEKDLNLHRSISENISSAIWEMLRPTFVEDRKIRVFNFYVQVEELKHLNFFGEIMDDTLGLMDSRIAVRVGIGQQLPSDNERHYSVLLVDSVESLSHLYRKFLKYHLHINGYFIILLHTFKPHYYDDLHSMIELNWEAGVVNANVIVYALRNLILLFTGFPFSEYHCQGFAPVIDNKFIDSHWQHGNFFPDKISNLYGCPLVCATWEDLPYFALARAHKIGNVGRRNWIGIEGKLLEYLAETMNFSVTFRWMNDAEIAQTLDDEGAVFDKLFESGTDFVIGAFHYKPRNLHDSYAPTRPYYLSNFNLIINSASEPYSPFIKLLLPFVYEIWAILLLIFIFGTTISLVVKFLNEPRARNFIMGTRNETPIYNMFVISLGGTLAVLPGRNFARFLLSLWLIATMVLRCAYQAFMYHFIRTDISVPLPNTIDAIIRENYKFYMTDAVYNVVGNLPHILARTVLMNGSEVENFDVLRGKSAGPGKVAILSAFEYFGYYKRTHVQNSEFHVVIFLRYYLINQFLYEYVIRYEFQGT